MPAPAQSQKPLIRDVLLRDGMTLRLQAPAPADYDDIKAFYDRLSPENRYLRFHGFGRTDIIARADAGASGVDRVALIARRDGLVVAAACYVGLREPGVAEVAFAVADADHRRGIATRMLEQLAAIAADRGIHRFDALVMTSNGPMLRVFEHGGFAVRRRSSFGELTVSLDITPTEAVQERIDERDRPPCSVGEPGRRADRARRCDYCDGDREPLRDLHDPTIAKMRPARLISMLTST